MPLKLSHRVKISTRTAKDLLYKFGQLVTDAKSYDLKVYGRKVSSEAIFSAILIEFFDLPEVDQISIIERGIIRYEMLLASDDKERTQARKRLLEHGHENMTLKWTQKEPARKTQPQPIDHKDEIKVQEETLPKKKLPKKRNPG